MRKPPNILGEWNGYPEIFSFSQALQISRQYLFLRTVTKKKVYKIESVKDKRTTFNRI